jgi:thioredoxin 1
MIELDINNFDSEVTSQEGIVIVDFWGENCEPCNKFMPVYEELSKELADKAKFCKLNTTKSTKLAISQRVMVLPTVVMYKDGKRVGHAHGKDASREGVLELFEKNA